ncbi:MAG: LLM class flavin-dependent oxidoreductase, partial [Dehalococcoidia bacterium]
DQFHVRDFHLREGPLDGTLPLYLAALNPRMVALAAQVADGIITNWLTQESLEEFQSIINREAEAAGRDPKEIKIFTTLMTCVDPNDETAMNALRRGLAFYCASVHYHHIAETSGFGPLAKRAYQAWQSGDRQGAARLIPDAMAEKMGLTGSPEACREKLRWMRDAGVYPIIYPLPRHDRMTEDHFATIRLAASYAG